MRDFLVLLLIYAAVIAAVTVPFVRWGERANDPTRLANQCTADGGTPQIEGRKFIKTIICNGSGHVLWVESTNNKEN